MDEGNMKLKQGVKLKNVSPQTVFAIVVADQCFDGKLVVTSVNDSQHMPGSKHFIGNAFDCRTTSAGIDQTAAKLIADKIRDRLGSEFDVVLEKDHIHVEYDPKE